MMELVADTSASQSISSLCCVFNTILLRILIYTINKKKANTKTILFHQDFYTLKKFHAQLGQNVHTQTPKHSTGLGN